MDFFQSQETAQRNTTRLVVFFGLAVISLIVITNLLAMVLFGVLKPGPEGLTLNVIAAQFDWQQFLAIGAMVSLVILAGSVYKTLMLAGGGKVVAESLGGRLISQDTTDLHERKALNVVEEMAIASGTPVPPVYLLEQEEGINAFAAGYTPADAVIGVTRGTIAYLSRDELQGVIGHEFSHILHGDMRLNIRLICILHGILLLGLIGYLLLRSTRGGSNKNAGPILGMGIGLLVIGYAGTFFGNLIKASVSRQREFLADASAVQYTRNKDSIAGALKKIGGYARGSELETPEAPSMSHAYFNTGVTSFLQSIFATHPPLKVRIKRIDPQWNGVFIPVTAEVNDAQQTASQAQPGARSAAMKKATLGAVIASQVLDNIGKTSGEHMDYATTLLNNIPSEIVAAVHEPYGARAVIYCLLINQEQEFQEKQLNRLREFGDTGIFDLVSKLHDAVKALDIQFRLPLIDMSMPALHQLSAIQYQHFKENLLNLIQADHRIDLFEWSLQKILFHHLDPQFSRANKRQAKFGALPAVKDDIDVLLSMLIYACVQDKAEARAALASAEKELGIDNLLLLPREQINFDRLGEAVDKLALLKPLLKPRLLKACLAVITQDRHYSPTEMELMRAIGNTLDCPIPPYMG